MNDKPHRRFNVLNGTWVIVSPHRTQRPWQGQKEPSQPAESASYDADCYLCPGNVRNTGASNPNYRGTYVFDNDYPALLDDASNTQSNDPLFQSAPVRGRCRVVCYSPQHDLTMAGMTTSQLAAVVDTWAEEFMMLSEDYQWVQIFENRGEAMGCSNPHPHGQIWATDVLPGEAVRETQRQQAWLHEHGTTLLDDYVAREIAARERVVIESEHWLLVVPYWAVWPFETLLVCRDDATDISQLSRNARHDLASVLSRLCRGYDALFDTPFPYSMGWHNAPVGNSDGWRLHAHFYPPLLRSATVRKFMVGYEMLAEAQRDLTAEMAARRLADVTPPP
ncbi:MAG: UDP-glucose--hexose-1-phosphate uridylyltransferase [Pseudomonadota bacterium]